MSIKELQGTCFYTMYSITTNNEVSRNGSNLFMLEFCETDLAGCGVEGAVDVGAGDARFLHDLRRE